MADTSAIRAARAFVELGVDSSRVKPGLDATAPTIQGYAQRVRASLAGVAAAQDSGDTRMLARRMSGLNSLIKHEKAYADAVIVQDSRVRGTIGKEGIVALSRVAGGILGLTGLGSGPLGAAANMAAGGMGVGKMAADALGIGGLIGPIGLAAAAIGVLGFAIHESGKAAEEAHKKLVEEAIKKKELASRTWEEQLPFAIPKTARAEKLKADIKDLDRQQAEEESKPTAGMNKYQLEWHQETLRRIARDKAAAEAELEQMAEKSAVQQSKTALDAATGKITPAEAATQDRARETGLLSERARLESDIAKRSEGLTDQEIANDDQIQAMQRDLATINGRIDKIRTFETAKLANDTAARDLEGLKTREQRLAEYEATIQTADILPGQFQDLMAKKTEDIYGKSPASGGFGAAGVEAVNGQSLVRETNLKLDQLIELTREASNATRNL